MQIKNVYGNGLDEEYRKNASDIELSIDALELCHRCPEINTYVFITSDSDMIPIMNRLLYMGKKIHLFCMDNHTSSYQNMAHFCHIHCDLLSLFEINPERKNPEYWKDQAVSAIRNWYFVRRNEEIMLGGKWLNQLFCDKFLISAHAASRLISYLKENDLICETIGPTGHTGFQNVSSS